MIWKQRGRRRPCDWNHASKSLGTPKIDRKHQKLEQSGKDFPLELSVRTCLGWHHDFTLTPSRLKSNTFLLFKKYSKWKIWCFYLLGDFPYQFGSVQSLNYVQIFVTPWTVAHQDSLSITKSWSLLKLVSMELVMPSNHLILWHPLLFLSSICPRIRVFSNESVLCIRWPKYWSFSFSISPSNEYSALISFRMDWLDLLAVQGTLKSLLQYHSSKGSVLQCSAFFMVQISHSYMTPGQTIALTTWTFVGKVAF